MARRAYGDGALYQRSSDGMWLGALRVAGGKRRYVCARTETEARRKLGTLKATIDEANRLAQVPHPIIAVLDKRLAVLEEAILARAKRPPRAWIPVKLRRDLLALHSNRCAYCTTALTIETMVIDHVWPLAQGGTGDTWNLVPTCWTCNGVKRGRTPEEAGMRRHLPDELRAIPAQP